MTGKWNGERKWVDPSGTSMHQDPIPIPSPWFCTSKMAEKDLRILTWAMKAYPRLRKQTFSYYKETSVTAPTPVKCSICCVGATGLAVGGGMFCQISVLALA